MLTILLYKIGLIGYFATREAGMKRLQWALASILLGLRAIAWADGNGGGTFYHADVATTLTSAYAYSTPDEFDKSKQAIVVVFRDQPIDAATFDAALDREKAFHDLLGNFRNKGTSVQVTIGSDKDGHVRIEQVNSSYNSANGKFERSSDAIGTTFYTLDLKRNDGKRIEGSFRTNESQKAEKNWNFYDLHFALNVANGPPFGPGLPPDGGDPFKAYSAYAEALREAERHPNQATVQTLFNILSDARVKGLNHIIDNAGDAKRDEVLLQELKKMQASIPNFKEFVSGRVKDDLATMEIKDPASTSETGVTVTMKKEDGNWCFDKDQKHAARSKVTPTAISQGKSGK